MSNASFEDASRLRSDACPMLLLSLETTCDETAAAVINDALEVRSSVVASQHDLHQRFSGVVPEIAARAHVERILPVIDEALHKAGAGLADLAAIAVATTPGLAGSLLVGLSAAKALCLAAGKPLIGINHLHAHVYACRLTYAREVFPCVGFIVSGGHTNLYRCDSPCEFHYLGGTIDDAAGEAFDKVAAMLGLPYPGGPAVSRLAESGNPRAYRFPRSYLGEDDRLTFSFSGLKTAVRYAIAGPGKPLPQHALPEQQVRDLCASFQAAVVDVLVDKCLAALRSTNLPRLCVGGGVAANAAFRAALQSAVAAAGGELFIAPPPLCTDNAVMGAIAWEKYRLGQFETLSADVAPGLMRS
jgi:N6-L-threonylcarbamoyladenine synthase